MQAPSMTAESTMICKRQKCGSAEKKTQRTVQKKSLSRRHTCCVQEKSVGPCDLKLKKKKHLKGDT